jgi:aminobenzoyl-glutamate utilization protein B
MRSLLLMIVSAASLLAADNVLMRVDAHGDRFGAISRQIWENPELGFHENQSSALLQQELKANGFTVKADLAGMPTAFTAEWGSGKPVIGLMGEFDALRGLAQKDSPMQSAVQNGTSAAVSSFQSKRRITVTGEIDDATRSALTDAFGS